MSTASSSPSIRPVCFMVMPFGTKDTGVTDGSAPAKVNFDTLWDKALAPAIEALGYIAIRADKDAGAMIVQEMLERLTLADLVIADLTIPNGNVYYEIGIRHAALESGCVLISAEWTKALFDAAQMRRVTYPLPTGDPGDEQAKSIRETLEKKVPAMVGEKTPPFYLDGYPKPTLERANSFKKFVAERSAFQTEVSAARQAPRTERAQRVRNLLARHVKPGTAGGDPVVPGVALELLYLARDWLPWEETVAYIKRLPERVRYLPEVQEQYCLARSKAGEHLEAIGALEELVKRCGDSSERQGLIGGRYKKLYQQATDSAEKKRYLSLAIEHYERGMNLDLNNYYPSSNLPRLLKLRCHKGDSDRAHEIAHLVVMACERARLLKTADEWLNATLLGAAFDAEDVNKARQLVELVMEEGSAAWKLDSTIEDLKRSLTSIQDPSVKEELQQIINELQPLIVGAQVP